MTTLEGMISVYHSRVSLTSNTLLTKVITCDAREDQFIL